MKKVSKKVAKVNKSKSKKPLTRGQIIEERCDALFKTINAMEKLLSGSFEELRKMTKLSEVRFMQATVALWSTGGLTWVDPITKQEKDIKIIKNTDNLQNEIKNWAICKDEFENDGEYLFATIDLLPGSTFEELGILAELEEHTLCVAMMWLFENGRIETNEDELYFTAGIFDRI